MADPNHTRTISFAELQALADRLYARGTSSFGADTGQSQSDQALAAAALRGLLARCVVVSEMVADLGLTLTSPVNLGGR